MDFEEYKKEILKFFSELSNCPNRIPHTKQSAMIHLIEEVGEVARQLTNEVHRPEYYNKENLAEELADLISLCVLLADKCDIDLSEEMSKTIEKVKKRIKEQNNLS